LTLWKVLNSYRIIEPLEEDSMNSRIIGIILLCVLTNATIDYVTEDVSIPPPEFFVNPDTGESNVVIVVGSQAASEDVKAATLLATYIQKEQNEVHFFKAVHTNIHVLQNISIEDQEGRGFTTVDVPDASAYATQDTTPITYTLSSLWYFDDTTHHFWGNGDDQFQPWETHEEIQIRFDSPPGKPCQPYLCGSTDTDYDVPGLIYRADNIVVPPSIMVEIPCCYPRPEAVVSLCDCFGRRIVAVPEPWLVIHEMLPQFTLFNTCYTVVDGGAVQDINFRTGEPGPLFGTPYILTGTPHFETETLYLNEPIHFGSYTVELLDIHMKQNMGLFQVSDDGVIDSFWMIIDPLYGFSPNVQKRFPFDVYDNCHDINGNKVIDPGEITNITNVPGKMNWPKGSIPKKWIVDFIKDDWASEREDIWVDYMWDYYVDDQGDVWGVVFFTTIIVDSIKLLDDSSGIEIQVYWLEDEQLWYNHLCCDPWVTESHFAQFLDAYQMGWDTLSENMYVYQPPGTGIWPPLGLQRSEMSTPYIGNGFIDANDGHIGYEYTWLSNTPLPEQNLHSEQTTDNRTHTEPIYNCTNHDIEDPVLWHGPGPIMVEINISLCDSSYPPQHEWSLSPFENLSHFTIAVTDMDFCKDGIDYITTMVHLKPGIIMVDTEFPFMSWKFVCDYNVILIGGPVANMVVKLLVGRNVSLIDWAASPGQWEYIKAPYSRCDILIVAGKDREATFAAVQELINTINLEIDN
jgi:hypothetical protein